MRKNYDEPMFTEVVRCEKDCTTNEVEQQIRQLCQEQSFAVLATQGDGQPYTSLIAFATNEALSELVFCTPVQTRKFHLLQRNTQVSVMIDNRSNQPDSINLISGLTMTGRATVPEDPATIQTWETLFLRKHPYLKGFVQSPNASLVVVEAVRFFYVRRFQEVYQWIPQTSR